MNMIYFAQRGGRDGPIKIGFTRGCVNRRLRGLRSAIKQPLLLIAVMPGDLPKERHPHKKFAKYAIGNEYFALCGPVIEFMTRLESGADWCFRTGRHATYTRRVKELKPK